VQQPYVWLIGGTSDSAKVAALLTQAGIPYVVSVTTRAAIALYPRTPPARIWVGRLTPVDLPAFLHQHRIGAIVDASHPFAVEISQHAIAAATALNLPYLRYERPPLEPDLTPSPPAIATDQLIFSDISALLASQILVNQRVLLILGYRPLAHFLPWQTQATLFARILPSVTALEAAIAAGFTPDRILALRPPLSAQLEQALWQHWHISLVVTKASGRSGGEDIKRQVAQTLGIPLITIARPPMTYPQQTSDMATVTAFCQHHCPPNATRIP